MDGKKENFGHTSDKIPKAISENTLLPKAKDTVESGFLKCQNTRSMAICSH